MLEDCQCKNASLWENGPFDVSVYTWNLCKYT